MPMIHGKSNKAFEHNLKTEMHEGKPQKRSLAIAYAIKRRAAKKKMAEGGLVNEEDMGRNHDEIVKSQANKWTEEMHPEHDISIAKNKIMPEEHYGFMAQEHEDLDEPKETKFAKLHPVAEAFRKLAKGGMVEHHEGGNEISSPRKPVAELKEDDGYPFHAAEEEGEHFAHGGILMHMHHPKAIAHALMKKHMAAGGKVSYPTHKDAHYADGGPVQDPATAKSFGEAMDRGGPQEGLVSKIKHAFSSDDSKKVASKAYGGMIDDDDFLSDEEQTPFSTQSEADAEGESNDMEMMEHDKEDPKRLRRGILSKIMGSIHANKYGR